MSEKPDETTCKLCNKLFNKYSDLLKHNCKSENVKSNEKKSHSCEICGKVFKLIGHLKRHVVLHTGEKQYVCDVCQRPFSDKSTLRKHFQTHTGERNYKCDICGKCFTQRSHMKTHLLIHTGEKGFECNFCGKTFRYNLFGKEKNVYFNIFVVGMVIIIVLMFVHIQGKNRTIALLVINHLMMVVVIGDILKEIHIKRKCNFVIFLN